MVFRLGANPVPHRTYRDDGKTSRPAAPFLMPTIRPIDDRGPLGIQRQRRYGATRKHARIPMAEHVVPHFHNDPGIPVIEIGAHEFMCVGATPPYDHPHVFLDMGDENEIICPYCSTLYRFDEKLDPHEARPASCALPLTAA
jgi:uncharacterized Zn-finger protein